MDDLVIDLFASSAGEWNKCVMIEFRMLMIVSQKKTRHKQNRKPLRNTLFSRRGRAELFLSISVTIT